MRKYANAAIGVTVGIVIYGWILLGLVAAQPWYGQVRERLVQRLESGQLPLTPTGASLQLSILVPRFYAQRSYHPAWSNGTGLTGHAERLLEVLREGQSQALDPRDYHLPTIERVSAELRQHGQQSADLPERLADLELLLSHAFFTYGTHLLVGKTNPHVQEAAWVTTQTKVDLVQTLHNALATNRVPEVLRSFVPAHTGYTRLRQAFIWYRLLAAAGGWPMLQDGPLLEVGMRHEQVKTLRERLRITGDLDVLPERGNEARAAESNADLYDQTMAQAVRIFQERHGLDVDGIVGPATRAALNVPVQERLQQIALNMARWHGRPRELGVHSIQVNIPAFMLDVIEAEQSVLTMRVIVGKPSQPTPIFSETMTYLVLNPYWQVPARIARNELLPRIRQDPAYLTEQNMTVLQGWGAEAQTIAPHSIDWLSLSAQNFPYRLRQQPGPNNALGRVKFIFPNRHHVYLHDTPARSLFAKSVRAFSHGCVRVEQAMTLAEYLLQRDARWTRATMLDMVAQGSSRRIDLPTALPVHMVYHTAWVDTVGAVHFRSDIYQLDRPLDAMFCGVTPCG